MTTEIQQKFLSPAVLYLKGRSQYSTLHLQGSMHRAILVGLGACGLSTSVHPLCGRMKLHAMTAFLSTSDPVQKASEDSKLQGSMLSFHSNMAVKHFHVPLCAGLMLLETRQIKILGCGYMWKQSTMLLTLYTPSMAHIFFPQTSIYILPMILFELTMSTNTLTIMPLKLLHSTNLFRVLYLSIHIVPLTAC